MGRAKSSECANLHSCVFRVLLSDLYPVNQPLVRGCVYVFECVCVYIRVCVFVGWGGWGTCLSECLCPIPEGTGAFNTTNLSLHVYWLIMKNEVAIIHLQPPTGLFMTVVSGDCHMNSHRHFSQKILSTKCYLVSSNRPKRALDIPGFGFTQIITFIYFVFLPNNQGVQFTVYVAAEPRMSQWNCVV